MKNEKGVVTLDPTDVSLYDIIIEKTAPSTENKFGMMTPSDLTLFISIQDMLSSVKDYDGENYFSVQQSADSDSSDSVSTFSAKEQSRWQEYGKTFRENIEQALAGEVPRNKVLKVCDTPLILQELGIPNLPIKMHIGVATNTTKVDGAAPHAHGLTLDMLEQIPQALNEPVFVLKSATQAGDIVVFTDVKDTKERSVIVPVALKKDVGRGKVANVIKSIYGRNAEKPFVTNNIINNNMLYANRKKSLEWLRECGLQLPDLLTKQSSLIGKSIAKKNQNVNSENSSN